MDARPLLRLVAVVALVAAAVLGLRVRRQWPAHRASGRVAGALAVFALAAFALSTLDLLAPRAPVPDALFVYYRDGGTVAAASAVTGTVRWRYTPPSPSVGVFLTPCSLSLDRGVFYFRTDGAIRAVRARDGQELWVAPVEGRADQQPLPTADHGVVYASSPAHVVALRGADGSQLWQTPQGATPGSATAAPQVANGVVYVAFSSAASSVYALDARDGVIRWTHTVARATSASLVVADGIVYAAYAAPKTTVVAFDAANGAVRWTSLLDDSADAERLAVLTVADGVVVLRDDPQLGLVALDVISGSLLWQLGDLGQHGDLGVGQLPIIANGMVYLAASLSTGNVSGLVLALDARTGHERWRTILDQYDDVYVSLAGPMLYVGGSSAYALRGSDGHIVWRYSSGSAVQFYQPVAAAGVVFIGSTDLGSFSFHPFGIGSSDFLNALDARTGARYWRTPAADIECTPQVLSS